jgi:hypothetical protein
VLFARFMDLLGRHGIEVGFATDPFRANGVVDVWGEKYDTKMLPSGTLVVRAAQPRRRLLKAILQFDPHMSDGFLEDERKALESHRGTKVYDVTAWNLCMAYGLEAFWAEGVSDLSLHHPVPPRAALPEERPAYGYVIDGASSDIYRVIVRLLGEDCKVRVATQPFTIDGYRYEPGTVLLRNHENPRDLPDRLSGLTGDLDLDTRPVNTALCEDGPDLGGRRFRLLVQPRIAIASQWPIAVTSFGSTWHLLDSRIGLRTTPLNLQALGRVDLRKYTAIAVPHVWSMAALSGVLQESALKKLRAWVEAGGTLIALGNSAAFVAGKDRGLSSVRLRRDVLDQLPVYEEALKHEHSALNIEVDPQVVWGTSKPPSVDDNSESPTGTENPAPKRKSPPEVEALKRKDTWRRLFGPRGPMVAARCDTEHWLCFGLPAYSRSDPQLPVLLSGQYALMSKHPVQTPVRLVGADELRLSGLLWPEARERFADTAWATVERVGYGQIVLFASDPFFRGYLEGTGRLFLNALLLGPGLGTSQPVPW